MQKLGVDKQPHPCCARSLRAGAAAASANWPIFRSSSGPGPKRPVILRLEHVVLIGQLSLGGCDVPERMKFSRRSSSPRPPSAGALCAQRYACFANFSEGVGRHRGPRTSFQARKENKHAALVRTHTSLRPPFLFFFLSNLSSRLRGFLFSSIPPAYVLSCGLSLVSIWSKN